MSLQSTIQPESTHCLVVYIAYKEYACVSRELAGELLSAFAALDLDDRITMYANAWEHDDIVPRIECHKIVLSKRASSPEHDLGKLFLNEIPEMRWPAVRLHVDGIRGKRTPTSDRRWAIDLSPQWKTGHGDVMPAHCVCYFHPRIVLQVPHLQDRLLRILDIASRIGEVWSGVAMVEDAAHCLHGECYWNSLHGYTDVLRFLERRLWSQSYAHRTWGVRKPAWAMILGPELRARCDLDTLRSSISTHARVQSEAECIVDLEQVTSLFIGRSPLGAVCDFLGDNAGAMVTFVEHLRKHNMMTTCL